MKTFDLLLKAVLNLSKVLFYEKNLEKTSRTGSKSLEKFRETTPGHLSLF